MVMLNKMAAILDLQVANRADLISRPPKNIRAKCDAFAAVSLCGVAGLAETIPSLPCSGPFLPDVPGFHVPSDSVFPSQPLYSFTAVPHSHFDNCAVLLSIYLFF